MTLRIYQMLVIGSLLLYGIWRLLPYTGWTITEEAFAALQYAGAGAWSFTWHPLFSITEFAIRAAATLGMFLLLTWGRSLFVVWLAAGVVIGPVSGVIVVPAVDNAVGYLSTLIDGVLVVLSFSQPIGRLYRIDGHA